MSSSMKVGFSVSGSNGTVIKNRPRGSFGAYPSVVTLQFAHSKYTEFMGKPLKCPSDQNTGSGWNVKTSRHSSVNAQASIFLTKALRWWEKTLTPNMVEIHCAQELVDSLSHAGDRLVIIDFYSPGCGGCKALHPKICQLAESNPNAVFLKVNYEELKTMCHTLHIHVLPFFRFYRGAEGKVCSFSCTNATIKKFKDALAKYGTERCSLGPAKGLEEKELQALASTGQITRKLRPKFTEEDLVLKEMIKGNAFGKEENAKLGLNAAGNAVLMA